MNFRLGTVSLVVLLCLSLLNLPLTAQSTATLRGTVTDESGAVVANANVTAHNQGTGVDTTTTTDSAGAYQVTALPPGNYTVTIQAPGFQKQSSSGLVLEVNRIVVQNLKLKVGNVSQEIVVTAETPVIETGTVTVGQVIDQRTVQEIPLNGRHFVDLGLLVPGSVTPPQNGFLTAPLRGQGSFGINTAGNREDEVNFMINGINLNDMANGQITFQPTINTVSEFKVDNSTYSADEGRNAGAIVNIATRSGTNAFHGEAFNFMRNDAVDARNFFNKSPVPMSPFKRNNFGASLGGPIVKDNTFFFISYEGLRQRQGVTLNTNVLTDAQRQAALAAGNPTIAKVLPLIPAANDPTGANFIGSATAPVDIDQGTADLSHNFGKDDRLHGYYVFQRDIRKEPILQGGSVPGAGDTRQSHRQIMTLNEVHTFSSNVVNEARLGYNRIHITFVPDSDQNPADFGINNGINAPVGLPRFTINGTNLAFGGIRNFPQGRGDYTAVVSDTVSHLHGRHALKYGGEFRRFNGNSFTNDDGAIGFNNVTDFINGVPNAFAITGGSRAARVYDNAFGLFVMDHFRATQRLTLELGLRWDWNMSPTEAEDRSVAFIPSSASLVRLGTDGYTETIQQNNKLFQPRLGFIWDVFGSGKAVLRGGYGVSYDQPLPGPFIFSGNPPLAQPVAFTPTTGTPFTSFATLLSDARGSGLAPGTTQVDYKDAYVQSWNLNIESQLTPTFGTMIGYFGNKGTHLNTALNINQITNGVRPFPRVSTSSPNLPNSTLGNIVSQESVGNSNYNALWVTANKRMGHGLQFNTSYTWSHALDYNSRNFQGLTVQNTFDPRGDYGSSDFDVRHRFVLSAIYSPPLHGGRLKEGWQISPIIQLQSGNPLNVLSGSPAAGGGLPAGAGISGFTGAATIRPDLVGTPTIVNTLITSGKNAGRIQWFPANSACDPRIGCPAGSIFAIPVAFVGGANVYHFGNLRRNQILGPDFHDVDLSISKTTPITERVRAEVRLEAFDLLNHPNFGNPDLTAQANSTTFGVISGTRFPTGDSGSSRQLQLALKLTF